MSTLRNRIEKGFEQFAHVIFIHRMKTLMVMVLMSGAMMSQIPNITIDTSIEGFLRDDDPARIDYNAFRDQFGRDEVVIIALKPSNVFDPSFLQTLKSLHETLEENVPYIDDITSLINARNTRGQGDELIVEDLLENWPETEEEIAIIKQRVLSNDVYKNLMISEDGHLTTIIIRNHSLSSEGQETDLLEGFENEMDGPDEGPEKGLPGPGKYLSDAENSEVVYAVEKAIQQYQTDDLPIWVAGSPVVIHFLKQSMMQDMRKFVALAALTVAVLLFFMFRRISGVILPLFIVVISLLCTVGIMAFCGVAIKVPTQILPSFLLAVGVGTSVHILAMFYHHYRKCGNKVDSIAYALGHSGLAVLMTNVTTAAGLMSFSTAEIAPVANLGVFAGIGVLLTFVNSIVFLPALLALFPIRHKAAQKSSQRTMMGRFLTVIGNFSTAHPKAILLVSAVLTLLSIATAATIRFSHHPLSWFPEDNPVRMATEKIDHELRGSLSLELVIDTGMENGLYEPEFLNRMEQAASYVEKLEYEDLYVGKAWSVTTILKEIHQALNENRSDFYKVPGNRDLVAQEFLLFENSGSDDLEDFVDSRFSKARLMIKVPFKDAYKAGTFLETVDDYFYEHFPEAEVTLTGMITLLFQTLTASIRSMAKSYAIALVVITVLMILLIGRVRIGLLSMIPNLVPILLMLGVIGSLSLPMDLFTMLVASIAIGLAVDDTIHFMHNFRRYYELSGDPVSAVHKTLQTAGRAMLVTSVVLSIGFFIFGFATLSNVRNFGLLTGFTVMMALLSDYLIAPALMVLVNKKQVHH